MKSTLHLFSRYLPLLLLCYGVSSCDDFLEEEPRDVASVNQFFTEPSHAENAVNALYRDGAPALWMAGGVYSGRNIMYGPYLSGFFDNGYKGQEPFIQFAQQLSLDGANSNDFMNSVWSRMYRTISRANNAIKYIPTTAGLGEDQRDRLLGEARFMRGWAYFMLVRHFGDVPLITEPYESLADIYLARAPAADVYALIVEDVEFAVNAAGLPQQNMISNGYRVTQPAAATLLADIQLTRSGFPVQEDNYAAAASAARSVINGGSHGLIEHDLDDGEVDMENSAYNKMRRQEEIAREFIYPIEYTVGISDSPYPPYTMPVTLTGKSRYGITNGAYEPRDEYLEMYDEDVDLRIQNKQYFHNTFTDADGNTTTFQPLPYLWYDEQAVIETAVSELEVRAYSYPEVLLIAAEAIARSEGVTAEAIDYLTRVRGRAYYQQSEEEIAGTLTGLSVAEFVEEVWAERNRELVMDFKIWFDMVRTRKYPLADDGMVEFVDLVGQENTWGQVFQERNLLLPLPEQELQRNTELVQNTGYAN
jgi:hypothetical protein